MIKKNLKWMVPAACLSAIVPTFSLAQENTQTQLTKATGWIVVNVETYPKTLVLDFYRNAEALERKHGETYEICLPAPSPHCQNHQVLWHKGVDPLQGASSFSNGFSPSPGVFGMAMGNAMVGMVPETNIVDSKVSGDALTEGQRGEIEQICNIFSLQNN